MSHHRTLSSLAAAAFAALCLVVIFHVCPAQGSVEGAPEIADATGISMPVLIHKVHVRLADDEALPELPRIECATLAITATDTRRWVRLTLEQCLEVWDATGAMLTVLEDYRWIDAFRFKVPGYVDGIVEIPRDATEAVTLELLLEPEPFVMGRIVDARTGDGLANVTILSGTAAIFDEFQRFVPSGVDTIMGVVEHFPGERATTGVGGTFQMKRPRKDPHSRIWLIGPHGGTHLVRNPGAAIADNLLELPIPQPGRIMGRIMAGERPYKNVGVHYEMNRTGDGVFPNHLFMGWRQTDGDGRYEFVVTPGYYRVDSDSYLILPGQTVVRDRNFPGGINISGRTLDENGQPMPGCTVTTEPQTKSSSSDREAKYLIQAVPPGKYSLQAKLHGQQLEFRSFDTGPGPLLASASTAIDLKEDLEIDLILVKAPPTPTYPPRAPTPTPDPNAPPPPLILDDVPSATAPYGGMISHTGPKGRLDITVTYKEDGRAVPGAIVVIDTEDRQGNTISSDEYTLPPEPTHQAMYRALSERAKGGALYYKRPGEIGLIRVTLKAPGAEPVTREIRHPAWIEALDFVVESMSHINGRLLTNGTGEPIPNVMAVANGEGFVRCATSDAEGRFSIPVPQGEFHIYSHGSAEYARGNSFFQVRVGPNEESPEQTLLLERAITLKGKVYNSLGDAAANAMVWRDNNVLRTYTNERGEFALGGVLAADQTTIRAASGSEEATLNVSHPDSNEFYVLQMRNRQDGWGPAVAGREVMSVTGISLVSGSSVQWQHDSTRKTLAVFCSLWHPEGRKLMIEAKSRAEKDQLAFAAFSTDWYLEEAYRHFAKLPAGVNVIFAGAGGLGIAKDWGLNNHAQAYLISAEGRIVKTPAVGKLP